MLRRKKEGNEQEVIENSNNSNVGEEDWRHREIYRQFHDLAAKENIELPNGGSDILRAFLSTNNHVSVNDLKGLLAKEGIHNSEESIERILHLAKKYGVAREQRFEDQEPRFEHLHLDDHHDHIICLKCGKIVEIETPEIDAMISKQARNMGFSHIRHRMEIYGICPDCRGEDAPEMPLCAAPKDSRVEIVRLAGGSEFQRRLTDMGLYIGAEVRILNSGETGPCVVALEDARIGIGVGMARKIMVRIND